MSNQELERLAERLDAIIDPPDEAKAALDEETELRAILAEVGRASAPVYMADEIRLAGERLKASLDMDSPALRVGAALGLYAALKGTSVTKAAL